MPYVAGLSDGDVWDKQRDGQKGWHDAGDYGKYAVNAVPMPPTEPATLIPSGRAPASVALAASAGNSSRAGRGVEGFGSANGHRPGAKDNAAVAGHGHRRDGGVLVRRAPPAAADAFECDGKPTKRKGSRGRLRGRQWWRLVAGNTQHPLILRGAGCRSSFWSVFRQEVLVHR